MKNITHPLQTKVWADFRQEWGNEIVKTKYGYITLHKMPLLPFKIGVFEKGPMPSTQMLVDLKKLAKNEKLIFIKLEPNCTKEVLGSAAFKKTIQLLAESDCVRGKTLFTPTTFWIDLTPTEEELMKSFSSKTRYNIRLSARKGVQVVEDNSDRAFKQYLDLMEQTVKRQGFYAHNKRYHKLMWKHLYQLPTSKKQQPTARLLKAIYKNSVISSWIVFIHDKVIYYPYGASSISHKDVMANNLMMWEAIKLGKKYNCTIFDLWGREEGKGFTRFKEGYNPKVVEFLGSWDLVTHPFYRLYRILEYLRWKTLRLKSNFSKPIF